MNCNHFLQNVRGDFLQNFFAHSRVMSINKIVTGCQAHRAEVVGQIRPMAPGPLPVTGNQSERGEDIAAAGQPT
jgi:hypothetical protein